MKLPEAFLAHCRDIMGDALLTRLTEGLSAPPTVSIRMHPWKSDGKQVNPALLPRQVAWCERGFYLDQRPNFTFDPLLHAGAYYVQEASSMFVDEVARQAIHQPITALDLCAAPGGKTTALLAALPEGSVMVCNEYVRQRAHILAENIMKWGYPNVVVTNNSTNDIRRSGMTFDLILADVPCSGEGMFRKDEGAITEWSEDNVRRCSVLQREILEDAWACLRPGGWLIYSTCTFNIHEDEENVAWAMSHLGAQLHDVDTSTSWNITGSLMPDLKGKVCHFIPGVTQGEGLFMALLHKPADAAPVAEKKHRDKRQKKTSAPSITDDARAWIEHTDDFVFLQEGNAITAIPRGLANLYDNMKDLKVMHAGVPIGTWRGRKLVPSPALALSTSLRREAFTQCEVDYPTAIAYLRNEAISLPPTMPRGYILMTYHHLPLGFVNNIGNRANNLYPQEWRIRSSHAPDSPCEILI